MQASGVPAQRTATLPVSVQHSVVRATQSRRCCTTLAGARRSALDRSARTSAGRWSVGSHKKECECRDSARSGASTVVDSHRGHPCPLPANPRPIRPRSRRSLRPRDPRSVVLRSPPARTRSRATTRRWQNLRRKPSSRPRFHQRQQGRRVWRSGGRGPAARRTRRGGVAGGDGQHAQRGQCSAKLGHDIPDGENRTTRPLSCYARGFVGPGAHDEPGRAGRRQPAFVEGGPARARAARRLHPSREDHALRSRAHPRAHRPRARLRRPRLSSSATSR